MKSLDASIGNKKWNNFIFVEKNHKNLRRSFCPVKPKGQLRTNERKTLGAVQRILIHGDCREIKKSNESWHPIFACSSTGIKDHYVDLTQCIFQVKSCCVERLFEMNSAHLRVRLIFKPFGWPDDVMQFRLPLDLPRKPCNVWLGGWAPLRLPTHTCFHVLIIWSGILLRANIACNFPLSDVLPLVGLTYPL